MSLIMRKLRIIQSALEKASLDKGKVRETWVEISLGGAHEYVVILPQVSTWILSLRIDKRGDPKATCVDRELDSLSGLTEALRAAIDVWGILASGRLDFEQVLDLKIKSLEGASLIGALAMKELMMEGA